MPMQFVSALNRKAFFARHKSLVKRLPKFKQDIFHGRTLDIAKKELMLHDITGDNPVAFRKAVASGKAAAKLGNRALKGIYSTFTPIKNFRGGPAKVRRVGKK